MEKAFSTAWIDALGAELKYYDAGGVRTRCLEAGQGEPVLLLHGMGGHLEAYVRNVVPLGRSFHVYAIDLIGHGLTDKPDIDYALSDYVAFINDFLDAIGAERAHLVGESLGGWIAAWLAIQKPERVGKLVLVTGAGLSLQQDEAAQRERIERLSRLSATAVTKPTRQSVRQRMEWLVYDPETMTDELVEIRYRFYSDPLTQDRLERIRRWLIGSERAEERRPWMLTEDQLRRITVPTFVLWTRHNPTTGWQVAEQAARLIPRARFHVMEDCGHWPQFEKPEEFNRLLMEFLTA